MDGSAFNKLPVDGIMRFAVFGLVVAGLLAIGLVGALAYILYLGVMALLS